MSVTVAGFVKNGVVVPNAPLPEGAFVEVHVIHGPIEVPPELQEEFDAWQRAGAESLKIKAGQMFQPIRVAVCGRKNAPPLFETLEVLGRDTSLQRIDQAIQSLK